MVKTNLAEADNTFVSGARTQHLRLSRLHNQILSFFRSIYPNGATDRELEDNIGRKRTESDTRRRRGELVLHGLIRDSGQTRGEGKYKSKVWVAVPWQQEQNQGEH